MSDLEVCIEDRIAVVSINRPAQRNSMTLAMWRDMATRFDALDADPAVRAIILTGAGKDFSTGADITEFGTVRATAEQAAEYERAVDRSSEAIANAAKPTFAVVRGYCLGGGCHLSMSCDFRFADPTAVFGIPAARLSIVYGVESTRRLLALVGLAHAKRILFSAERFAAEEALRIGFIEHCSADPLAEARRLAATMAQNAPLSLSGAKRILNRLAGGPGALDPDEAQALIDAAADSHDYREGRDAFREKRVPVFQGR